MSPTSPRSKPFKSMLMHDLAVVALVVAGSAALLADARAETVAPNVSNGGAYNNNPVLGFNTSASVIRLANLREPVEFGMDATTRNYLEVYSVTQGKTLGTMTVDVPPKASLQVTATEILGMAGITPHRVADGELVVYIQNGRAKQLWQHLQYDPAPELLVDAGTCTFAPALDYLPAANVVLNAYTSIVQHVASLITLHNFADQAGTFDANVYDARTGEALGTVEIELPARSSFNEAATWFEDAIGFAPARNQPQINIELVPTSTPEAKISVGHATLNLRTGAGENVSHLCALTGGIITLTD